MTCLLALDQGTSSSRSIIFRPDGSILASAQAEFRQIYPQPGWVEHDPLEIWQSQLGTARQALAQSGLSASSMASVGITNQRETTVVWDRASGQPIHNAIVWQSRQTADICEQLKADGYADLVRERTGVRPVVLGHSAGGHMAACMLSEARASAAVAISGVFDLAPLIPTSLNKALDLDEREAAALSPIHWPIPNGSTPGGTVLDCYVGAEESPEFLRQSRMMSST